MEDFKRHKADRKMNHSEVEVISPAGTRLKKWKDVCVGDIIKVQNEKYFPADLILLSSSEPAGNTQLHIFYFVMCAVLWSRSNLDPAPVGTGTG